MPHKNDTLNFMCVKGEVSRRLIELEIQHEPSYKGLVLQTKPYKSVFTSKQYAKGKLVLVPSTQKIERKACPGSVALGSIRDIGLHLWPCYGPPKRDDLDGSFLCPFWMVKRTNKESEANVEVRKLIAEDQENNSVRIPLMYNISALDASTELKLFVPSLRRRSLKLWCQSRSQSARGARAQGSELMADFEGEKQLGPHAFLFLPSASNIENTIKGCCPANRFFFFVGERMWPCIEMSLILFRHHTTSFYSTQI
jgi:hypothetical protein